MDFEPPPRPFKKRHLAVEGRQRAVRACNECRRLKEKCEDGMPCKRCRHLRRPCKFSTAPITLDKQIAGEGESHKELMDRQQCMESILKFHFPNLGLDTGSLRRTCNALSSQTTNPMLDETTDDGPLELPENIQPSGSPAIEDEDCTIDHVDAAIVHYSGEFSHWNFSMHVKRNIDEIMTKSNMTTFEHKDRLPDFIRVGEADPGSTCISDLVAVVPPRPVAAFLTNVFFKHATSFYYYVDQQWVDQTLEIIHTDSDTLSSKDVTAVCVVLMVLAVGTQYVHLENTFQQSNSNTRRSLDGEAHHGWELEIGSAFYRHVSKLMSEVIHAGSLLSVQIFLLLGLYSLPIDASGLGYIYLNLAIKVAIQNGMHRRNSRGDLDPRTKEIKRRIWWTAYCLERKIAIYHGRPASIARSDIDIDIPSSFAASRSADDLCNPSGLLESIKLSNGAEAFLNQITRLRTCARSEISTILNQMEHMKTDLEARWLFWADSLSTSSAACLAVQSRSRAEIQCRLECCLLRMFIGRPFILNHCQRYADANAGQTTSEARGKAAESFAQWEFLVQDCVGAAKEAISICQSMQTGDMGLAKSSYAEYSSCRGALLVLIAYSVCYRTNEFSTILHTGLDAIREMASSGESARSEVSLLEALEAALHTIHVSSPQLEQATTTESNAPAQEGYEGFLNWYKRNGSIASSIAKSSSENRGNAQKTAAEAREFPPQVGLYANAEVAESSPRDYPSDDHAFNFEFLNPGGGIDFFNLDQHSNTDKDLFEILLNSR